MSSLLHCADSHDKSFWPFPQKGQVKILLTDPPYALGPAWKRGWHGNNGNSTLRMGLVPDWDKQLIDKQLIEDLIAWSDVAIIFGGNFYDLPPSPCWFIWDKLQSNRGSDAEMAWTNANIKGIKVFRMSRIDAYFNKRRFIKTHLAEKPVQLFSWCLSNLGIKEALVFDPFMGSGNSAVAAVEGQYDFVGIDINKINVDEAAQRLASLT
jgi:hypothetical protein